MTGSIIISNSLHDGSSLCLLVMHQANILLELRTALALAPGAVGVWCLAGCCVAGAVFASSMTLDIQGCERILKTGPGACITHKRMTRR